MLYISMTTVEKLHSILFAETNPVYYDIGARNRIETPWLNLAKQGLVDAYGFEPDPAEYERLRHNPDVTILPYALGNRNGISDFYVTRNSGCSSCLKPNYELLEKYPYTKGSFNLKRKTTVELVTLNSLIDKGKLPPPEFIKIDVQGLEYEVLEGCSRYLHNVKGIKLETHLQPLYEGERTFFEIYEYLYAQGFILRQMNNISYYDGEQIEYDAFFVRPISADESYLFDMFFGKIYALEPPKMGAMSRTHRSNNTIPEKDFYNKYPW